MDKKRLRKPFESVGAGNTATEPEHSPYYYDYPRNDPIRENPFENDGLDYEVEYIRSSAD